MLRFSLNERKTGTSGYSAFVQVNVVLVVVVSDEEMTKQGWRKQG